MSGYEYALQLRRGRGSLAQDETTMAADHLGGYHDEGARWDDPGMPTTEEQVHQHTFHRRRRGKTQSASPPIALVLMLAYLVVLYLSWVL